MIKLKQILSEIVVKPAIAPQRLKDDLVATMVQDLVEAHYEDITAGWMRWKDDAIDNGFESFEVKEALGALRSAIGVSAANHFYYNEAFDRVYDVVVKWDSENLDEIVVKPASSYEYNIGDKLQNKVGGVLVIKARYKDMEEAIKANPSEHGWAKGQIDAWTGEGRWYGLASAKSRGKKLTIVPEERLATLTKL